MVKLWKQLHEADAEGAAETVLPEYPTKKGVVLIISREHGSAGKRIGQLAATAPKEYRTEKVIQSSLSVIE